MINIDMKASLKLFSIFTALFLSFLPKIVLAQSSLFNITYNSPLNSNIRSIEDLIVAILNVAVIIAVPIITLFIIYAGFLYVTARGNAEQVRTATTALTYAIIGGVLIIGAVAITAIIETTISAF